MHIRGTNAFVFAVSRILLFQIATKSGGDDESRQKVDFWFPARELLLRHGWDFAMGCGNRRDCMTDNLPNDSCGDDYGRWLAELKQRVERALLRAVSTVNRELVALYRQIGRQILDRQQRQGWGAGVVNQLARDLKAARPGRRGFSVRNLKYM